MATTAESIYASSPYKFIIDGNALYIHSGLISRHSKPLDRMINGSMSEAAKGFAVIEDVDEHTFTRFIQWAYNGYYDAAQFVIDISPRSSVSKKKSKKKSTGKNLKHRFIWETEEFVPEESTPQDLEPAQEPALPAEEEPAPIAEEQLVPPADEELLLPAEERLEPPPAEDPSDSVWAAPQWGSASSSRKVSKKPKKGFPSYANEWSIEYASRTSKQQLREAFIKRKQVIRQTSISIPPPHPNQKLDEDYTEVFLSHARLYVFADKYDIQPLKTLALEELQTTLAIFTLFPERTGDVIALLRYVYANTQDREESTEEMRALMRHYIGFEMDTLMLDENFRDLMIEEGGDLLGHFMEMVGRRIGVSQ